MPFLNTMQPIKILIVEDFHAETDALLRELNDSEFNHISEIVRTEEEFKNGLHRFDPDVILSPYSLASTNAVKLLSIARNEGMNMPFILLAYDLSEDIAIELLGEGVEDYILRSTLKRLPVAIRKALQRYKTQLELQLSDVKLRESEASLQKAQTMAKLGSWDWEVDKDYFHCSDELFRIYGIEKTTFTVARAISFIHPKDKGRLSELMETGLAVGLPEAVEYTIIAGNGEVKDVRVHAEKMMDAKGNIIRIVGTLQDISERKKIELELVRSQSLLSLGEEISHSGSFELDLINRKTIWSANFYRIVGIKPSTVITNKLFLSLIHPKDRKSYQDALAANLEVGVGKPFVYRVIRPDNGQIVHLLANGRRVEGESGEVRWIGSVLDITERVHTQLELETRETSLKEAQKLAQLGSWEMDMETGELQWSEEMYSIHGVKKQKATRELFMGLVHPDDHVAVIAADNQALTGESPGMTYRIIRPDNQEERTLFGSKATLIGTKLIGTVQDITERVRAQREIEAQSIQKNLILSTAKIGVWHYTIGSDKLVWDENCAQLFDEFTTEIDTEKFYFLIHPEDRNYVRQRLIEGLKTGEYSAEYRLTKNGSTTFVLSRGVTTVGIDGKATCMDGIIIDITDRKKEQEQIKTLSLVASETINGVLIHDPDGKII